MKHTQTKEQWYQDFMSHREAYGRKKPANDFTRCFLNWCMHTYPDEEYLTQEMLEVWGTKRNTEKVLSHGRRATAVNHFVEFINERGDGPYNLIEYEWGDPSPEPILASKAEMANFFKSVDELPTTGIKNNPLVDKMLLVRAIEAPVLFRMLYSTGIRVNEIRWLHRDDVDLENGIIYVRRSKGYYERIIALHPTMTELLCKYDRLIRKEVPDTEIFFPNADGSMHNSAWIRVNFKALWYKYNPKPADGSREVVPYVFRHNYAIENIMSWDQRGYNADKKMVALSKSMGHRGIQSTQYYFHLVPRFADLLDEKEGASVSEIIPDIL